MLYLHVGMHKTGTTFLQRSVFPKLSRINYLGPWSPFDHFLRMQDDRDHLISNERLAGRLWASPEQVEFSIRRLAGYFPDAQVMIGFRPHEDFIVSSYKQYLHQGGTLTFPEYFDLQSDRGFMSRAQFRYRMRLELLDRHFSRPPFAFLLDELRNNLDGLLRDLTGLMDVPALDPAEIDPRPRNRGVTFWQAEALRRVNRYARSEFNPGGRFNLNSSKMRALRLNPRAIAQHWLWFLPDHPFLDEQQRSLVQQTFAEDWHYVQERVASRPQKT